MARGKFLRSPTSWLKPVTAEPVTTAIMQLPNRGNYPIRVQNLSILTDDGGHHIDFGAGIFLGAGDLLEIVIKSQSGASIVVEGVSNDPSKLEEQHKKAIEEEKTPVIADGRIVGFIKNLGEKDE